MLEIVNFCLVNKDVPVCQEKDSFFSPLLPEAPDDLKFRESLSRTCCHNQQDSVLPFCNCLYCPVNCYTLIISQGFLPIGKIVLGYDPLPVFVKPLPFAVFPPEKFRGRKFVQRNFLFYLSKSACPVVEQKGIPIRAECKRNVQHLSIHERLLHALSNRVNIPLCFHNCKRKVGFIGKYSSSLCFPLSRDLNITFPVRFLLPGSFSSQLALLIAGVINFEQISRSLSSFLFTSSIYSHPAEFTNTLDGN